MLDPTGLGFGSFPKELPLGLRPIPPGTRRDRKAPNSQNHKTARRLGPTASPNGEHKSGVAPHAFGCPASLGGVSVLLVALGVVVVAVVIVTAVAIAAAAVADENNTVSYWLRPRPPRIKRCPIGCAIGCALGRRE